jgi:hypothetical protein
MKNLTFIICFLLLGKVSTAQKDSLAFDEHGKYIYYKVVNMDKYSADTLYKRSLGFFKNAVDEKSLKLSSKDEKNTTLTGSGLFIVYKKASLAKHPDGQIAYQFKMEIKDFKYRYWLTGFVYKPYFRDRYNNYVPDNGIEIPLEQKPKTVSEKDMNEYLDESALFARQLGDKLKKYIITSTIVVKKEPAKKVISTTKW